MIKRIIFLVENRFDSRDYQRFGIELLQENGFCVEVWDLSYVLHHEIFKAYAPSDAFSCDALSLFNNKLKMYSRLSNLSCTDFVISLVSYSFWSLGVYRALGKSYADYAIYCVNILPEAIIKKTWLDLLKQLGSFRYPKVWKKLFMRLPFRWLGVKRASLFLAGGDRCFNRHYPVDKDTEVLQIHALDYDLYLKEKVSPCTERPVAVFLDEFYPFHLDHILLGGFVHDADKYYKMLNLFFDTVEKKTGFEVIIAAHPRSNYEKHPDYFNGRECVKGNTIKVVRESKLVLAHSSTALNLANLFYKPVVFMTWEDISNTWESYKIKEMSRWFGKIPISIDRNNNIDFNKELVVDRDQYNNYRRGFIKVEGSKDLPFWQIVANRLKEY